MNLAYFRKSTFTREVTVEKIRKQAAVLGLTVVGATELPGRNGVILHISNPVWTGNLIASDMNLIGLLPGAVAVVSGKDDVMVGVGSPAVLGSVSQNPAITQLVSEAEEKLKDLVNVSAGVGPLKPTGITLYSTMTCPYCKMEAAWLQQNNVKYDEVHVDMNRAEAEIMVQKTGQMGVPVTAVHYEGGEEEFIIGFNKPQLAQILGI